MYMPGTRSLMSCVRFEALAGREATWTPLADIICNEVMGASAVTCRMVPFTEIFILLAEVTEAVIPLVDLSRNSRWWNVELSSSDVVKSERVTTVVDGLNSKHVTFLATCMALLASSL